jgi:uncharacterized repeat protein (TIGR01451 family)
MKNIKKISLTLLATGAFLFSSIPVAAGNDQYGQYGQYGQQPGDTPYESPTQPVESLIVDKLVAYPGTVNSSDGIAMDRFVDNFSPNDKRFNPKSRVIFRVKVKNTSNVTLEDVTLKDYIPGYMEPVSGPGNFDVDTRVITYVIPEIKPGEEKIYDFEMQIVDQDSLPSDKGLICLTNKAEAYTDKVSDEDSSQMCVEKKVQNITTVPKSGPELGLLILAGNLFGIGAGTYLTKFKKQS